MKIKSLFLSAVCLLLAASLSFGQNVPNDWYFGNPDDTYQGISVYKAYNEFIKDKKGKTVVVAIIDSGIDIDHEDLKENLWVNPKEVPGNGKDDDNNGYIDDIHGWNFIGGPNGANVGPDSYEAVRVYNSLKAKYEQADVNKLDKKQKKEYDTYVRAKSNVEKEIQSAQNSLKQITNIETRIKSAFDALEIAAEGKTFDKAFLDSLNVTGNQELNMAKNIAIQYLSGTDLNTIDGIRKQILEDVEGDRQNFQRKLDYSFNASFDPRKTIVKDDYTNVNEKYYGNADAEGPDPLHGTHVGGIVGALRGNSLGADGIAPNVKLMSVRAVPDGDERDKDVANAIRYAVDNGASVINMSFGKGFGTHKQVVDEAVKYAASKDVLLVHAAGNSAQNNDITENFPNAVFEKKSGFIFKKKQKAKNWIEVGALSYRSGEDMVAGFSNYGKTMVDIFAPGVQIYATTPDNSYAPLQGTSMASPVVAAVAAAIRSYYPELSAVQVKESIMNSATKISSVVKVPGSKTEKVSFADLSISGGIVNMYEALMYASTMK